MSKKQYQETMTETSKEVLDRLNGFLVGIKKEDTELFKGVSEIPNKKFGTFETRAYLLRISYEVCSGKKWTNIVKNVAAAIEIELASMYYSNRIFDDKGGEIILSKPKEQYIISSVAHGIATKILHKSYKDLPEPLFKNLLVLFNEIYNNFYIGQWFEVSANIFRKKEKFSEKKAISLYEKRNYGVNNSFFEKIAIIGSLLANSSEKQEQALAEFGKNYGMALQIINDIGDFVPSKYNKGTDEKLPSDAYSDIKHGKLTLPIIYGLKKLKGSEKRALIDALVGEIQDEKVLIQITLSLIKSGAIKKSQEKVREYIKRAKEAVSKEFSNKNVGLLEELCFIAYTNRYYKALKKLEVEN